MNLIIDDLDCERSGYQLMDQIHRKLENTIKDGYKPNYIVVSPLVYEELDNTFGDYMHCKDGYIKFICGLKLYIDSRIRHIKIVTEDPIKEVTRGLISEFS